MKQNAERCPVCYGTGKYTPPQNPFSSAISQPQTCHGCEGKGWVSVIDESLEAQISKVLKAGCVKLAENQDLPEGVGECMDCTDSSRMLKAGWRRVEL